MENRFDELAKDLAGGMSRREALRRFGGALAGALLASLSVRKAWGGDHSACIEVCKQHTGVHGCGNACLKCDDDPNRICYSDTSAVCCSTGSSCVSGNCVAGPVCPSGETDCSGICVDTSTDTSNCGTCGITCAGTMPACCSGICRDLSNDTGNCGTCGNTCNAGEVCSNGACTCPGMVCAGTCVDTNTDPNNCGTCGNVCPTDATCSNGVCGCNTGGPLCGTVCCGPRQKCNPAHEGVCIGPA
jgi:hypothetical protein